ncbi:MAG: tRNA preQ1(34) S-adenosylmethionine ribosyltransferase-isomerase QueA [Parasporobacterium sp.]|nr:tRNA preQ1(34) S-adenosylmethionine ribosyltransferase-isomerase QueA [Parasporobacterium sp.]
MTLKTSDFYYDLPEELIAQDPLTDRASSRLMTVNRETGAVEHRTFRDIIDFLNPGDCLVINDTKVIPARLFGVKDDTGAVIEILLLKRINDTDWECLVKPGRKARIGCRLTFGKQDVAASSDRDAGVQTESTALADTDEAGQTGNIADAHGDTDIECIKEKKSSSDSAILKGEIIEVLPDGNRIIRFEYKGIFEEILDALGQMPLPPYITHKLKDRNRYQTVYAKHDGSAAAPTAGLHFTEDLLKAIEEKGVNIARVTLHVGLGTFRPVKEENILDHEMHSEFYIVTKEAAATINAAKAAGGRIICVGTTSTRTLESAADESGHLKACSDWTSIFIYPGYKFKITDALITNFHLPESTLLMLVSAFSSREIMLDAYRQAVDERYRFFSFGDAMFLYK